MPRNRLPRDRAEKREEILAAATQLFTDHGYDETPMTQVAATAGVTTNTIYWYFDDKDALLVAVLDVVLTAALDEFSSGTQTGNWADQLMWAIDRLRRYHRLMGVVHARAGTSPAINTWHEGFHHLIDSVLAENYRQAGASATDIPAMTRISVFVVEGLLTHPSEGTQAVVDLLSSLMVGQPVNGDPHGWATAPGQSVLARNESLSED